MPGYHFTQRTEGHQASLQKREREVETAVRRAIRGLVQEPTICVHETHFHLFAEIKEKDKLPLIEKIKTHIAPLGVQWNASYHCTPIESVKKTFVNQMLKELHKDHGFSPTNRSQT